MTFLFVCLFIRNYHKKANKRSHSADTTSITEMKFNWKRVWIFAWVMSILANGEQYTNCLLFFFLWNLRWNSNEYQCAMCIHIDATSFRSTGDICFLSDLVNSYYMSHIYKHKNNVAFVHIKWNYGKNQLFQYWLYVFFFWMTTNQLTTYQIK